MRTTIRLPIESDDKVLVKTGDEITPKTILIDKRDKTTDKILHVSRLLSIPENSIHKYLKKNLNEETRSGEVIVEKKGWWSAVTVKSPLTGRIKIIDLHNGTVTISASDNQHSHKITIPLDGKVTHITNNYLEIEVSAPVVIADKGEGDEVFGKLISYPGESVSIFDIDSRIEDKIALFRELNDEQIIKLDVLGCQGIISIKLPANMTLPFLKVSEDKYAKIADHHHQNVWMRPKDKQLFFVD